MLKEWQSRISDIFQTWPDPQGAASLGILAGNDCHAITLTGAKYTARLQGALKNIYPNTYALLDYDKRFIQKEWMFSFFRSNLVPSYKLRLTVSGFPDFLADQPLIAEHYPFLADVACYERLISDITHCPRPLKEGFIRTIPSLNELADYKPIRNPISTFFRSQFSVIDICHCIASGAFDAVTSISRDSESTEVFIYRHVPSMDCHAFFFKNRLTAVLLSLCDGTRSYEKVLESLYQRMPQLEEYQTEDVHQQAALFFQECLRDSLLLGSMPCDKDASAIPDPEAAQ